MSQHSTLASSHEAFRSPPELPNEIIQQIFATFATTLTTEQLAEFPCMEFPWFLGHICSTWRYIFLSMTTEFWSSIMIFLCSENVEHAINVVRFFLEREPEVPFSFYILFKLSYPQDEDYRQVDQLNQIMEMLVDKSMRWEEVSFNMSAQHLLPLTRTKDHLPLLQKLTILLQSVDDGIPDLLCDVFQNSPSLYSVRIRYLADWKFNWLTLRDLDLGMLESRASEFVAALPQMTKLECLGLGEDSDAIPSSTIVLPSLTTLTCRPGWLRFLRAPALEDLRIKFEFDDSASDIVLHFLCRSCCTLKLLRLAIISAQASTVIDIIRHTPRLAKLELWDIANPGDVFKQLIIPTNPAQEPLACHLLSLLFCGYANIRVGDMSLLFLLISSRTASRATGNRGHKRLQQLKIAGDVDGVSLVAKADLIALCEERGVQYVEEYVGRGQ